MSTVINEEDEYDGFIYPGSSLPSWLTGPEPLRTFQISCHEAGNGHKVFGLRGGMSAEACVAKSLASLSGGTSASWSVYRYGPEPVPTWPGVLDASIQNVVDLYRKHVPSALWSGKLRAVAGPGPMLVPYLCHHTRSLYLPTHFLVSFRRMSELRATLDTANKAGLESFAVAGYDGSMAGAGVAWLKLLSLPQAYRTLMEDYGVGEIMFVGVSGSTGEGLARKVLDDSPELPEEFHRGAVQHSAFISRRASEAVSPGDVYIQYTASSNVQVDSLTADHPSFLRDVYALRSGIEDMDSIFLEHSFRRISDWESGIGDQLYRLIPSAGKAGFRAWAFTSDDSLQLYNAAAHIAFTNMKSNGEYPRGIVCNPYFSCHPEYEEMIGYLPFCFWQAGNPSKKAKQFVAQLGGITDSFKGVTLVIWDGSTSNFGGSVVGMVFPRILKPLCAGASFGARLANELIKCLSLNSKLDLVPSHFRTTPEQWTNDRDLLGQVGWVVSNLKKFRPGGADDLLQWGKERKRLSFDDVSRVVERQSEITPGIHLACRNCNDGAVPQDD